MALKLFYELNKEKSDRIVDAALKEFARYGYNESSTNRIVKQAKIAKGSLYKYFESKESLYFHVLDAVVGKYVVSAQESAGKLPNDLFERVLTLAEWEFAWYLANPDYYKLFKNAFLKESQVYQKSMDRYGNKAEKVFSSLFEGVNVKKEKLSIKLSVIKWVLEGFNRTFINGKDIDTDVNGLKEEYVVKLREVLMILKSGIGA